MPSVAEIVKLALEEDVREGDITSAACCPNQMGTARFLAKADGVLSGLAVAHIVFNVRSASSLPFLHVPDEPSQSIR